MNEIESDLYNLVNEIETSTPSRDSGTPRASCFLNHTRSIATLCELKLSDEQIQRTKKKNNRNLRHHRHQHHHRSFRPVLKHGPRKLTYVRVHGGKHAGAVNATAGVSAPATDQSSERGLSVSISVRTAKDGELCPRKGKLRGDSIEARSDTDVQVVRHTWVQGRKPKRTIQ